MAKRTHIHVRIDAVELSDANKMINCFHRERNETDFIIIICLIFIRKAFRK